MSDGERPAFAAPSAMFGSAWPIDIARLAERMDVHPVGYFAGHPQHPRIHRGDIDFGVGLFDLPSLDCGVMKPGL